MKIIHNKKIKGFTLVETIVTIGIFTLLLGGIITLFIGVFRTPQQQLTSADNVDQARRVLAGFTNEMRNATLGSDGSYQINQADNTQIVFFTNYGATGSIVYRIRYYISGSTLYKGVTTPTGSPLSYNLASEKVTPVEYNLSNGATPLFYYYDDSFTGSGSALSQPVNITQIRFVKINLVVLKQETTGDTSTFTVDGGATIRSLKTNLGN
jgi:type II secretory pathway pseudopilin PulG